MQQKLCPPRDKASGWMQASSNNSQLRSATSTFNNVFQINSPSNRSLSPIDLSFPSISLSTRSLSYDLFFRDLNVPVFIGFLQRCPRHPAIPPASAMTHAMPPAYVINDRSCRWRLINRRPHSTHTTASQTKNLSVNSASKSCCWTSYTDNHDSTPLTVKKTLTYKS